MKKTILFSLLMLSITALRASETTSIRSKLVTIETICNSIGAIKDIRDGKKDSNCLHSLLCFNIPTILIEKHEKEINNLQPSVNLAAMLVYGIATCRTIYCIHSIYKQRTITPPFPNNSNVRSKRT